MNRTPSEQELMRQMREDAAKSPVPDSLKPEMMKKRLEQYQKQLEAENNGQMESSGYPENGGTMGKRKKGLLRYHRWLPALGAAACLMCAVGFWQAGVFRISENNVEENVQNVADGAGGQNRSAAVQTEGMVPETEEAALPQTAASYDEIYQAVHAVQERRQSYENYASRYYRDSFEVAEEVQEAEMADGAAPIAGAAQTTGENGEMGAADLGVSLGTGASAVEKEKLSYSGTNVQVAQVDEEDILKTDGMYLYHLIRDYENGPYISIVRAKGAEMEEISRIRDLGDISGFYLQNDTLVCVEQLWLEQPSQGNADGAEQDDQAATSFVEDGLKRLDGVAYVSRPATRITFFDISDRSRPEVTGRLTTDGSPASSRIYDGYFYLLSRYTAPVEADPEDPSTFVPSLNGRILDAASIIIPQSPDTDSYLVAASVSLEDPTKFVDSKAILSTGNQFHVSTGHIYVADTRYQDVDSGSNLTNLTVFSYKDGQITGQKSGLVKGEILDDFAMNEYNGYLRVVTTVDSFERVKLVDNLTGNFLGYSYENETRTNSLYVLDSDLNVVGKIEGLAEGERVYSARFMGDTGYFVTFKQIDPLFSVDLSDPVNPKVLGELKISGFSEYLHFYSKDLLLGIGQEVDPETLRSEGLKLSMFDISDPADVKEIHKLVLGDVEFSEAYYDYKAVLIDPEKNLFGFPCDGVIDDSYRPQYRTYSYDPEKGFEEGVHWVEEDDIYTTTRGAYIGHILYVVQDNGTITAYHLGNNQKVGELDLKKE